MGHDARAEGALVGRRGHRHRGGPGHRRSDRNHVRPPRVRPSALLDVAPDVKSVAAELDGRRRGRRPRRPGGAPATRSTRLIGALGGVDVLVNNAGILRLTPLLDITVDEWDLVMDVNARSMLVDDPGRGRRR